MGDCGLVDEPSKPSKLILINVQVFDGTTDWSSGPVYIVGNKIVNKELYDDSTDESTTVDCDKHFLIPGLIESHVHVSDEKLTEDGSKKNLETLRQYGITTCFDMECQSPELLKSLRNLPGLPDVLSAGYAAQYQRDGKWPIESSVKDSLAAKIFVVDRVDQGCDYIKMDADPPRGVPNQPVPRGLDIPSMRTLAKTARAFGLFSIAHAMKPGGIVNALAAGVDIVTHAPLAPALDGGTKEEGVIMQMKRDNTICIPTLTMMKGTAEAEGANYDQTTKKAVSELYKQGVPLLAGTDANSVPEVPFSPKYGSSLHDELRLLVEVGLTPLEALKAATELPAKYFRLPDRGSIEPGNRADLVLLPNNPLDNIDNARAIEKVWLSGKMFDITQARA